MDERKGVSAEPAVREERKVVTALFADLVGSTALAESLDPEDVKLVVGDAIARVVAEIERFGGHVKDLAGDGALAFFGAPVTSEDDAERAVRAALRIVEEVDAYGAEVAAAWRVERLRVRVGVATGQVVVGLIGGGERVEYAAFGDTVNVAARLQSAADPGNVLVDEETRRQTASLFEWGEPRELELKGKTGLVGAWPVSGTRAFAAKPRGIEGVETPFVGRDAELAGAREALDAVRAGYGTILFATGEAGIGKSRLLLELRHAFERDGASATGLWLEGRCVSYGESLPYWPFRDLLREWLGAGRDDPELRVRVALRRAVESLFPDRAAEIYPYVGALLGLSLEGEAAARLAQLSPEALQYRTFEVVETLISRLAAAGPLAVAIEDLHWADPTSIQLAERLLGLGERAAVAFVFSQRDERDHPSWALRELALREFPHVTRDLALEPLSGDAERELLHALVGAATLPEELEREVLARAEGNPFYLEELVRSLEDAGALVREGGSWRFDHDVPVEVPPTVEKVILSRIDRLEPRCHSLLTAASVLGRRFGLPLLEGVVGGDGETRDALHVLQRLDLVRPERRLPEPEYRFKHALIQEAAYRTLLAPSRRDLHRRAAEWLEEQSSGEQAAVGLLAHHWLAAEDEEKAVAYLQRAGDKARQEYALDEAIGHYRELLPLLERRGEAQQMALVLFKLALALHTSLRFAEANATYARAFDLWRPPPPHESATATLRIGTSFLPNDADPKSAIAWPNIQLCMQLFDRLVEAWPERTLVPSLAERWEIADDGLRYVFHLREGLEWSDGTPLTAHDVEFGIKRVLDPRSPGSSVAIYFVLENGQDYYLGRNDDASRIGVRALDDTKVEFRLVAPAPYFMSVMNRPDGGPQPRHVIEEHGDRWIEPELQVVSGPFRIADRGDDAVVLTRRDDYVGTRSGNVGQVELLPVALDEAFAPYERGELDLILIRYTPRIADVGAPIRSDAHLGPAGWTFYLAFDHETEDGGNLELRRALAHAVDRDGIERGLPPNLVVARGGVVPPALQGHTPDIAPRYDVDLAREHLRRSGRAGTVAVATFDLWLPLVETIASGWRDALGIDVEVRTWTAKEALHGLAVSDRAALYLSGWLPGYPDPEYYLRLLLHSDSKTNEGGFSYAPFDEVIERARQERRDRERLELFHEAERLAVADRVALIPIAYGRSMAFVKRWVRGWWEFGKSSSSFADLFVDEELRR